MTVSEFKQNIRTWVVNVLGVEVIFSHGSGPRPSGKYAVINILNIESVMTPEVIQTRQGDGAIQADYNNIQKSMVSINIYRDDSLDSMINLKNSLGKISIQDYFNNLNIGILVPNAINRVPEQIGKSWENRSQCDYFFHYVPTITPDSDVSEIKQIEVTNNIDGTTSVII